MDNSNNMKLNATKIKTLTINFTTSDPSCSDVVIDNEIIKAVKSFKLLGVHINQDLK